MRRIILSISLIILGFSVSGCSVFMAAHQPDYKDLSFLKVGVDRDTVLINLGVPAVTEKDKDGNEVDYFKFRQGYGMGNKTVRMLGHGVADVFSLGLWEVVGTPSEAICNGHDVAVKITFDSKNQAKDITYLKTK